MKTHEQIIEEFSKRWKNVECSAHERTSNTACICDSLDEINSDYGYDEIAKFFQSEYKDRENELISEIESLKPHSVLPEGEESYNTYNDGN